MHRLTSFSGKIVSVIIVGLSASNTWVFRGDGLACMTLTRLFRGDGLCDPGH